MFVDLFLALLDNPEDERLFAIIFEQHVNELYRIAFMKLKDRTRMMLKTLYKRLLLLLRRIFIKYVDYMIVSIQNSKAISLQF